MTREEILKEFKGVEGINEAKKIYKTLAKKLHPDMDGGNEEAFKILNLLQIPAFILECDDKVARRLRNAENKQRRDINAYDETYGELEEIQLYCDFSTLDEAEKALRKAKRIIGLCK